MTAEEFFQRLSAMAYENIVNGQRVGQAWGIALCKLDPSIIARIAAEHPGTDPFYNDAHLGAFLGVLLKMLPDHLNRPQRTAELDRFAREYADQYSNHVECNHPDPGLFSEWLKAKRPVTGSDLLDWLEQ